MTGVSPGWIRACLALGLVLCLRPGAGRAEDPRAAAQRHYRRAVQLYDGARYEAAYDEMKRAYALDPVPGLLFNMARAAERLDRPGDAADHLEAYLQARPDEPDAAALRRRVAQLRRQARGEAPDGAAWRADTDGTRRDAAGVRRRGGADSGGTRRDAAGGAGASTAGGAARAGVGADAASGGAARTAAGAPGERGGRTPPWPALVLGGAGAVVLATGVGLGIGALGAARYVEGQGDAARPPVFDGALRATEQSGRAMGVAAIVLDVVGAAALGAGVIWTASWLGERRARARALSLAPAGAGAVLVGRF